MPTSRPLRLWAVALWGLCLVAATGGQAEDRRNAASPGGPPAAVALWGLCLVAATGGQAEDRRNAASPGGPPAAVGVLSATADPAVLPARLAEEVRVASQGPPLRILALAVVLATLVGLPAVLRRRASIIGPTPRPLRARRHAIALRAPPLQFA